MYNEIRVDYYANDSTDLQNLGDEFYEKKGYKPRNHGWSSTKSAWLATRFHGLVVTPV